MKSSILRAAFLLLPALVMVACGGKATYEIKGDVFGLSQPGLVMKNGTATVSVPANANSYTFPQTLDYGTEFTVEVASQPQYQECRLRQNGGAAIPRTAGQSIEVNAQVECAMKLYAIGGDIKGLKGAGLTLTNGSAPRKIVTPAVQPAVNTVYVMPVGVAFGTTYGLAILAQPAGQNCKFDNPAAAVGTNNGAPVQIDLTCVDVATTP